MIYSQDQLELIAIMFKIQFGDKTLKEVFPELSPAFNPDFEDIKIHNYKISISPRLQDMNFSYNNKLHFYFSHGGGYLYVHNFKKIATLEELVKMLNFEDKI